MIGHRLLRHVPHEAVPKRNSTGTSKRTEPAVTVGQSNHNFELLVQNY